MNEQAIDNQDQPDVIAAQAGDEAAFARIITRWEPEVARQMWRFTRDRVEHETLVHDVFVEAFFSLSSYQSKAPFEHWLRRLATFTGYKFWRQRERQKQSVPLDESGCSAAAQTSAEAPGGDGASGQGGLKLQLSSLLAKLKPDWRLVLTLAYFEELDAKQIAERLGWTHVMTRMRLSRARRQLRKLAEEAGLAPD